MSSLVDISGDRRRDPGGRASLVGFQGAGPGDGGSQQGGRAGGGRGGAESPPPLVYQHSSLLRVDCTVDT